MSLVGLDPDATADLVGALRLQATRANSIADRAIGLCLAGGVDPAAGRFLDDLAHRWRSAAGQLSERLDRIEALAQRDVVTGGAAIASPTHIFRPFRCSENDTVGPSGLVLIRGHLALIELAAGTQPDGRISRSDLLLVTSGNGRFRLPPHLRTAVLALVESPVWFTNVARAPSGRVSAHDDGELWIDSRGLDMALIQIRALHALADRGTFALLDAVRGGTPDGLVSHADIEAAIESGVLDPSASVGLQQLIDVRGDRLFPPRSQARQTGFARLETARPSPDDPGGARDGLLSYDDVVAGVVNLHAFADDPAAARRFVLDLPATFDDLSGASAGLSVRAHSDDGVRVLAHAALADAPGFVDQISVVARLPESAGGERNLLITAYYSELARRMNERLNDGLRDPEEPTLVGHTGANWLMFAPFASDAIRPALTGRQSVFGLTPNWSDRQYLADGNQYIFGDIAPRYALFLEAFPAGQPIDSAALNEFFSDATDPTGPTGRAPLWRNGHDQLRDAFEYYAAVLTEDDPLRRQQMTFMANALVATHEQAGAQIALEGILDQTWKDDEYRAWGAGIAARFGFDDRRIATDQMEIRLGLVDGSRVIRPSRDLAPPAFTTNNLLVGHDLTDDLNPSRASPPLGLQLPALGGWADPPPESGRTAFPISSQTWFERGGEGGTPDGRDQSGTGAQDWSRPSDRQWFIINMFRNLHADPVLWRRRSDYGPQRRVRGRPLAAGLPPNARRELDR